MKQTIKRLLSLAAAMVFVVSAFAQVTTSSMSGRVSDAQGPVQGAAVIAVYEPTGAQFYAVSDASGRYRLNNITAGGPYTVTISCLGYVDAIYKDVNVALSDNYVIDVELKEESMRLDAVVVSAEGRTSNMRSDRAGAITSLGTKQIMSVPTISRSMNDILNQTPQAYVSGNKAYLGGGSYRSSYVTVDGAPMNNAFGIGSNLPAGGSPMSLDALEQVAITLTPYDVRQSGFTGAGIATTTKSGTNEIKATVYGYFRNQDMQGYKVGENELVKNTSRYLMYGASIGGPIIKDKLFFFFNVAADRSIFPGPSRKFVDMEDVGGVLTPVAGGNVFTNGNDGVARPSRVVLDALGNLLRDKYGYDPGMVDGYSDASPSLKLLGRLDWNINRNHRLTLRYNMVNTKSVTSPSSSTTGMTSSLPTAHGRGSMWGMYYQNARYYQEQNFMSVAAELNSRFMDGRLNNVFRATYSKQNDPRSQEGGYFPGVDITVGDGFYATFGSEVYTFGNLRNVDTVVATDELTLSAGAHNLLLGLQAEYNHIRNGYQTMGGGEFVFPFNTEQELYDAIRNNTVFSNPQEFAITHGNNAALEQQYPTFEYEQFSAYLQDEINFGDRFKLTAGVRFEMPVYPSMAYNYNPNVAAATFAPTVTNPSGKYDSSVLPKAQLAISPRVGFNWDILGNRNLVLRGGTGIFTGRHPFVWIVAQGGNSGVLQTSISRTSGVLPTISNDRAAMVGQLYPGGYTPTIPSYLPQLTLMDPNLTNPQTWKSSLALDAHLPGDIFASVEAVYNKDMNPVTITNVGYKAPTRLTAVPDIPARPYYNNGYYDANMQNVFVINNVKNPALWGSYFSLTTKLQKRFFNALDASVSYTYATAQALHDGVGDQVSSAWRAFVTKMGTNTNELGHPNYVMPHRVIANLSYSKDYAKYFGSSIALIYYGGPTSVGSFCYASANVYGDYSYNYSLMDIPTYSDLYGNGGFGTGNWTFKDNGTYTAAQQAEDFWTLIQQDKYLSTHMGQIADRNTIIYPWVHKLDVKFNQNFYFYTGASRHKHTVQLGVDIQNFLNLLNPNWGNEWTVNTYNYGNVNCLALTNAKDVYTTGAKPVFQYQKDGNNFVTETFSKYVSSSSTWRMILSLRYIF